MAKGLDLTSLARLGAAARIEQIRTEMAALLTQFPELGGNGAAEKTATPRGARRRRRRKDDGSRKESRKPQDEEVLGCAEKTGTLTLRIHPFSDRPISFDGAV